MWAIKDFAGRYFGSEGWSEYTGDALLYPTCDEAERSMQDNGIVDAYCVYAGGDSSRCKTCVRWDAERDRCHTFPEKPEGSVCVGYEYSGNTDESDKGSSPKKICLNCSHYESRVMKCKIMPSYDNFAYYDYSCDKFDAKSDEPSQAPAPAVDDAFGKRYKHGSIECIDAIRAALTPEEFRGFCKGNVMKYVWRERHKGGDADLDKARDYIGYAMAGDVHGEL